MPYSRICLKLLFKMIWSWKIHVAIGIIFPFVWQRCNLSNFDQLISTLSPNGIILNSSQLNPLLPITETTHIDRFEVFADSSLPIGFFGWLLCRFRWFQLAYRLLRLTALALSLILACLSASLVDCFGVFADSSLPIGFFGWLLWGLCLFQLGYQAISVDCFGAYADSSLPIRLFRLTALAFSLIPACLLAFLVDCFWVFADSSLPISFFGWLLWRFCWF